MAEEYRIKQYYRPRVLIGLQDTLESTFPATMICLEGAELNILRNLMQYAERRVNWVAEYRANDYLTPDDDDWDTVQALVAGLEEKLMGCEEWTQLFEDMLAAMQCACNRLSQTERVTPAMAPVVASFMDKGHLLDADIYYGNAPIDEERCALAQLAYAFAWEMLTEVLTPIQSTMHDVLLPMVLLLIAERTGALVLGIPTGSLLALLWHLAEVAVEGRLEHVKNEYQAFKDELVCAAYTGLDISYRSAMNAVELIVWQMDLSPIEQTLLWLCFAPWVFDQCQHALDNETSWAEANIIPDYCLVCPTIPEGFLFDFDWPPCPNGYFLGGGACWNTRLCFNGATDQGVQEIQVTLDDYDQVTILVQWYSCFGSGWTVGQVEVHKWNTGTEQWDSVTGATCTNNVASGQLNERFVLDPVSKAGGLHRIILKGQPGQSEAEPYPFMVKTLTVGFSSS